MEQNTPASPDEKRAMYLTNRLAYLEKMLEKYPGFSSLLSQRAKWQQELSEVQARIQNTPALQPGQFEQTLFAWGIATHIGIITRPIAEQLAEARIGQKMILPGKLVRIVSTRVEGDKQGYVIAVCEVVSPLEYIKPRPYVPEMELK